MSTSHMPTPHGGGGPGTAGPPDRAGGAVDVKDHAMGEVEDLKVEVAEEARQVGAEARQHVGDIASTAAQELKAQADQQATRAGAGLEQIARQLSAMARSSDEQGVVPDLVASLGTQAEGLATRLQDGSFDEVVDDVRRFARRRPGLFLLAAAGAGFAASRVLRLTDISPSELTGGTGTTGAPSHGGMGVGTGMGMGDDATPPTGMPTGAPTRPTATARPGGMTGMAGTAGVPTGQPVGMPPTAPPEGTAWSTPHAPGQQEGLTR